LRRKPAGSAARVHLIAPRSLGIEVAQSGVTPIAWGRAIENPLYRVAWGYLRLRSSSAAGRRRLFL